MTFYYPNVGGERGRENPKLANFKLIHHFVDI